MAYDSEQEHKLRRYFLGELKFEEQVLVEQQLFLDNDYAEVAQVVEDDLIDDYLHDDLTVDERRRFEGRFLKRPEREVDLRIANALSRYIAPSTFVAPFHAAQFLETPMPRDAGPQPGSSLDEIGAVMDAEDTVESRREDSLTPSAESPKRKENRSSQMFQVNIMSD